SNCQRVIEHVRTQEAHCIEVHRHLIAPRHIEDAEPQGRARLVVPGRVLAPHLAHRCPDYELDLFLELMKIDVRKRLKHTHDGACHPVYVLLRLSRHHLLMERALAAGHSPTSTEVNEYDLVIRRHYDVRRMWIGMK